MKNKKCIMFKDGKCNSDYWKGKTCSKKNCPYKPGSFAMAVKDAPNRRFPKKPTE